MSEPPTVGLADVPAVSTAEMTEIDRLRPTSSAVI
ncbi:hypothetical protein BH23CHL6_BH23CHL6_07880 [soil metagenome]